jgi:hypothetical protein
MDWAMARWHGKRFWRWRLCCGGLQDYGEWENDNLGLSSKGVLARLGVYDFVKFHRQCVFRT